jgi:molybdate transport system regulatory protein
MPATSRAGDVTVRDVAKLTVRIDLKPGAAVGPGKIRLLELIGDSGSISAAGRSMGMSYRRAWTLVAGINQLFREPAVSTQLGGTRGGGAALTKFGRALVAHYRAIEHAAARAGAERMMALEAALPGKPTRPRSSRPAAGEASSDPRSPAMPRRAHRLGREARRAHTTTGRQRGRAR